MTEEEFDAVVDVHLKGTFAVSRWAARYWRDQPVGTDRAIVNTVSGSGLTNPLPTQSNYAAAKAGIAAMTTVHAVELARLGVRVNCVSPSMARTRLTLEVPGMAENEGTAFDPRHPSMLAPVAAYLASPGCSFNGQVFMVQGTSVVHLESWRAGDAVSKGGGPWTVAELAQAMAGVPRRDPLAEVAAVVGGALGTAGRDQFLARLGAMLDEQPVS